MSPDIFVLRCRKCRKDVALKAGTVMQDTKTPLNVWFWAAYLVATQFQRQLGLSRYETAFQRVGTLRGAGNAIVPQDGEVFIRAYLDVTEPT